MTRIAVIGIGAMGLPMATNLKTQFDVQGFDISAERIKLGEQAGLVMKSSAQECAKDADFALLAVRNGAQLENALFGDDGIAKVMAEGSAIILTSTVGIAEVESVYEKLQAAGIGLIDAPVSGGPVRAGNGDLLVVVGATETDYAKAKPVLDLMASTLVLVGNQPGKGQAMKTVNQLLCGVHIAAAGEALALANRLGLDLEQALNALMSGAAASFMLGDRGQRMLHAYDEEPVEVKSRLDIFTKDMNIVTSAAKSVGLSTPVAAAAEQLYLLGVNNGQGAQDDSSVILVVSPEPEAKSC